MMDFAGWALCGLLIAGLFAGLYVLRVKRQAGDPSKRGEDSSPPDGDCTETAGGGMG
jgi:hypothetical protein